MKRRVDIIVPVLNEPENFRAFYDFISRHTQSDWRLYMVYNVEKDPTLEQAKPIADRDSRVHLIFSPQPGALNAVKTGIKNVECEAVLTAMVDDPQTVLAKIDTLVEQFYAEQATIVVASRYMRGGSHTGGPFIKGVLSRLAGVSLHFIVGLPTHDATYATRLYRKSFLERTPIESQRGFELAMELTLKAFFAGEKIIETPVEWQERTVGTSRFELRKWLPAYLHWYVWALKRRYSPFVLKKS